MNKDKLSSSDLSIALATFIALAIMSFRQFFFYVPFENGLTVSTFLSFMAMLGWVSLVLAPPILLSLKSGWTSAKSNLLIAAVLIYPVATTSVKIYTLSTYGRIWAQYLAQYPILFFIEFLVPAIYVIVAINLKRRNSHSAQKTRARS